MTIESNRFHVKENEIMFSYPSFAGHIKVQPAYSEMENCFEFEVSLTTNGISFENKFFFSLEEAFKYIEKINNTIEPGESLLSCFKRMVD